jgi:hypothetical protein
MTIPSGIGANPLGVELALETRNFRSRPLALQLGASVFPEVRVVQIWSCALEHLTALLFATGLTGTERFWVASTTR